MKTQQGWRMTHLATIVAAMILSVGQVARAANIWDGGGANANWGTGDNWDDGIVPPTSATVTFGTGFNSGSTIAMGSRTVGGLVFNANQDVTLSGSQLTFNGNLTREATATGNHQISVTDQFSGVIINTSGTVWTNASTDAKLVISGNIRYNNHLTLDGPGTTEFTGPNATQGGGGLTIRDGTLLLNKPENTTAIGGNLTIGNGVGAAESAIVRFNNSGQLQGTASLTVGADGWLDLNGFNQTLRFSATGMTGSRITSGTGLLTVNSENTFPLTTSAADSSALIEGRMALTGGLHHHISVANGSVADDLIINANIESATQTIQKTGAGTLVLGGNNAFTTPLNVGASGTLIVTTNNALGTAAGGTTVAAGATLGFRGGVNYTTAEPVNAQGIGVGGIGAIHSFSGDNTFAGNISFSENLTIGAAAGSTLTLNGNVTDIGGGWRNFHKVGTGTVAVNGALYVQNYLRVDEGTFAIGGTFSSNRSSDHTVADGARLLVNGTLGSGFAVNFQFGSTLGGTGTIEGNRTLDSGRRLAPGDDIGTLTFGNNLTLNTGAIYDFEAADGTLNDMVAVAGTLTLGSGIVLNLHPCPQPVAKRDFTLFTFSGTPPTINNWTINLVDPLWRGTPEVVVEGNAVVLKGMVYDPPLGTLVIIQ